MVIAFILPMEIITTSRSLPARPPRSHRFLSLSLAAAILAFATVAQATPPQVPYGVFSIANNSKQPQNAVLADPDVDGITLRQAWSEIEPTEGNFDFSYLDTAVANCASHGKPVLLRIGTQKSKPEWVTQAVANSGGSFFTFTDTDGEQVTIPVFWDPVFLAKKKAMITALGAHFTNNPTIKVVVASFSNATSEDWNVPHGPSDVTQWLAVGYTTEKLLDAGKQIIDTTMAAFPNQIVALAVGGSGHINGTNLDPENDYAARAAVTQARADWPGRLVVQKNDLKTTVPPAPGTDSLYEMIWDFQPDVGAQMVYQCVNDPTYRANDGVPADPAITLQKSVEAAVTYHQKYVEIYQVDAMALPDVVAYAHQILTGGTPPPPTPTPSPTATPTPTPPGAPNPPTNLHVVP